MLSSLCWVPRGVPITKLPVGVDHNEAVEEEINDDVKAMDIGKEDENEMADENGEGEQEEDGHEETNSNEVEDGAEVDIDEILARDLDTLAFYKKGEKDPNLSSINDKNDTKNEIFDEEELEEMNLRATDSLVVAVKSSEDVSSLEVHVFDDDPDESDTNDNAVAPGYVPHTYIHHDIILPSLPLCSAYKKFQSNNNHINLIAVGMFTPGIDIWDVDQVNNLEPIISLGGFDIASTMESALSSIQTARRGGKKRRKRKPKPKLKEDSHHDAVMSLCWNNVQNEYLASGSADSTVKIWDIESSHCASTLTHHEDKVQAVSFHPSEASLLATGSFDHTIQLADVRSSDKALKWKVNADVETVQWGYGCSGGYIISTMEDGEIAIFDSRKSDDCIVKWMGHQGATTSCSVSKDISGLMVTAGVDKSIKVWDLQELCDSKSKQKTVQNPSPIYKRPSKSGALFSLELCGLPEAESNASPFVIACGGSKGTLDVVDLGVESEAVRERFLKQCQKDAAKVVESRASRCANAKRRRQEEREEKAEAKDSENMRDDDSGSDEDENKSENSDGSDGNGDNGEGVDGSDSEEST